MTDIAVVEKAQLPAAVAEPAQASPLLTAVMALAKDPGLDAEKFRVLLDMQAEREFVQAFTAMSSVMPRVQKKGVIDLGKGKIAFAKWEDMDTVIRPIMSKHGFSLTFDSDGVDGKIRVRGELLHVSGHRRVSNIVLPSDVGPGRNAAQAVGSTLSYGKRYCAEMLLNIVREGQDDDGKKGGAQYISDEQRDELQKLIADTGTDIAKFCSTCGVESLPEILAGSFVMAKNMLLAKKQKKNA